GEVVGSQVAGGRDRRLGEVPFVVGAASAVGYGSQGLGQVRVDDALPRHRLARKRAAVVPTSALGPPGAGRGGAEGEAALGQLAGGNEQASQAEPPVALAQPGPAVDDPRNRDGQRAAVLPGPLLLAGLERQSPRGR